MTLEGGAHTNFTTAGSSAGKGLVMLGLFPTERAMTWQGTRSSQTFPNLRLGSTVHLILPPSSMGLSVLFCRMGMIMTSTSLEFTKSSDRQGRSKPLCLLQTSAKTTAQERGESVASYENSRLHEQIPKSGF